jgi:hypothetical protein
MPEFLRNLWDKISRKERFMPSIIEFKPEQIERVKDLDAVFFPDKNYFTVRVNELFLRNDREWLKRYDPVVFIASEFVYDNKKVEVPFVVGPQLVQKSLGDQALVKNGYLIRNTTVAGTHPFKGDPFTLTVVLARLEKKDYLSDLLKLVENAAATYTGDFLNMVGNYLKVSKLVLDGIDTLFDNKQVDGLIGHRKTLMLNAKDEFRPGYYVLLNRSEREIRDEMQYERKNFFVKGTGELYYGSSINDSEPYRDADYVLYSVMATDSRSDIDQLPFYPQWQELLGFAMPLTKISEEQWEMIKGKFFALHSTMRLSPDLVRDQVKKLVDQYKEEIKEIRRNKEDLSAEKMPEADKRDKWDKEMDSVALDILKMK